MTTPTRCPICERQLSMTGLRAYDRLVTGRGPFAAAECDDCWLAVTVPQLEAEELGAYYADSYYEGFYEHEGPRASPMDRLKRMLAGRSAERRRSRPPYRFEELEPGRVLEVGCGGGELLADLSERGWDTYGIEPSSAAVDAAARRGVTVHEGTLADDPWPGRVFELIVFQHSLEHIPDPVGALRDASRALVPGGRLIVDVPNWTCWQRRVFGGRWAMLDMPRHLQHFSPRALRRLAGALQLRLEEVGTSSNGIAVAYSVHYLLAGRWTPGWKLWLSYAISLPLLPLAWTVDRLRGGDSCYAVMTRPR